MADIYEPSLPPYSGRLLLLKGWWWWRWWEEARAEGASLARIILTPQNFTPPPSIHYCRPLARRHGQPPGADPGAAAAGQGAQPGEAAGGPEEAHSAAEEMGCVREGDAQQEAKGRQEGAQCQRPPSRVQEACVLCSQRGTAGGLGQERSGWR